MVSPSWHRWVLMQWHIISWLLLPLGAHSWLTWKVSQGSALTGLCVNNARNMACTLIPSHSFSAIITWEAETEWLACKPCIPLAEDEAGSSLPLPLGIFQVIAKWPKTTHRLPYQPRLEKLPKSIKNELWGAAWACVELMFYWMKYLLFSWYYTAQPVMEHELFLNWHIVGHLLTYASP